jgi:hypothetical protein
VRDGDPGDTRLPIRNEPLIERRNATETMTLFAPFAIILLVLSPVLLPLVITGAHAIADWRRKTAPTSLRDQHASAPA